MIPEFTGTRTLGQAQPKFDTFTGVTRPTTLAILGAMLYLREGWLVGNCGLWGALLVIAAAYLITGTTALSVSSIATNTRVKAGGAFAIIAQSLGVEAGGAIGIPLFLAQSASAAMYLYAFTEGFAYMFPDVDSTRVVVVAFFAVTAISWISANLAFRAQGVLMLLAAIALVSAFGGLFRAPLVTPNFAGTLAEASLRDAFAIFFPASTGLMIGVGMSGSLKDPQRSIPRGTMTAWGVTLLVYVAGAFWYASIASDRALLYDNTIAIKAALVPELVLIGLLASTLTAATSCLVAAPRLLQAMAAQRAVPMGPWLELQSPNGGEPRNASIATYSLVMTCLCAGSLDAIAPIVTAFFIVTYLALNLVVFLEQTLGMISFRPTFRVRAYVPLIGVMASLLGLMGCSPAIGLTCLVLVGIIYRWLHGQDLHTPWDTVRSGVAVSVADWAAKRTAGLDRSYRAWKPDLLVPVDSLQEAQRLAPFLTKITHRAGSIKLIGLKDDADLHEGLQQMCREFEKQGVFSSCTVFSAPDFTRGALIAMDTMRGAFFPPNLIVIDATQHEQTCLQALVDHCLTLKMGLAAILPAPDGSLLGDSRRFEVWLSDRSPRWSLRLHNANVDLPILLAYLLSTGSHGKVCLSTVIQDESNQPKAQAFLEKIIDRGRLPSNSEVRVNIGDFLPAIENNSHTDLAFFGLPQRVEMARLRGLRTAAGCACVFVLDSGQESLLA